MKLTRLLIAAALLAAGSPALLAAEGRYVDAQTVRQAQQLLNKHGHRLGVDGIMGPRTQAALREFQKSKNLEPTGRLNRQTLVALGLQAPDAAAQTQEQRYSPETIRKVQATLNHRGYDAGETTGVMSQQTRSALRQFQKSENLQPTGHLNRGTLLALGIDSEPAAAGATAPRAGTVRQAQEQLNRRGYQAGPVDGVMGKSTRAAIREFQRKENLPVSGELDQRTLSALGIVARDAG